MQEGGGAIGGHCQLVCARPGWALRNLISLVQMCSGPRDPHISQILVEPVNMSHMAHTGKSHDRRQPQTRGPPTLLVGRGVGGRDRHTHVMLQITGWVARQLTRSRHDPKGVQCIVRPTMLIGRGGGRTPVHHAHSMRLRSAHASTTWGVNTRATRPRRVPFVSTRRTMRQMVYSKSPDRM